MVSNHTPTVDCTVNHKQVEMSYAITISRDFDKLILLTYLCIMWHALFNANTIYFCYTYLGSWETRVSSTGGKLPPLTHQLPPPQEFQCLTHLRCMNYVTMPLILIKVTPPLPALANFSRWNPGNHSLNLVIVYMLTISNWPSWYCSSLLVHSNKGARNVIGDVGSEEGHERCLGPVYIPQWQVTIIAEGRDAEQNS